MHEFKIDQNVFAMVNITLPVRYEVKNETMRKRVKLKWFDYANRPISDSSISSDSYKTAQDDLYSNLSIYNVSERLRGVYVLEAHLLADKNGSSSQHSRKLAEKKIELIIRRRSDDSASLLSGISTITWLYVLLVLFCILITFIVCKLRNNRFRRSRQRDFQTGEVARIDPKGDLTSQADFLPYSEFFEFSVKQLKFMQELGHGEFGVVYQAVARDIVPFEDETVVAVKTLKDGKNEDDRAFICLSCELKILSNIGHYVNIVNLLGAVTENIVNKEIMLILVP